MEEIWCGSSRRRRCSGEMPFHSCHWFLHHWRATSDCLSDRLGKPRQVLSRPKDGQGDTFHHDLTSRNLAFQLDQQIFISLEANNESQSVSSRRSQALSKLASEYL